MAITLFSTASNPADNSTLYDSVERSVTPPASMLAGDLVYFYVHRKSTDAISIANTGGQSWTAGTLRQTGSSSHQVFWCRFNGTWSANPSITTVSGATIVITLFIAVFRPTTGTNTWALDVAETSHSFAAPASPFDVTATGVTTVSASTVTVVSFGSLSTNTWALQTAGWANPGSAQYRNLDPTNSRPMSLSSAYKIQSSAGATGNVTNRETSHGGSGSDAGLYIVNAFKELASASVTVTGVTSGPLQNGQTGVVVTGTSFGTTQGTGTVVISPTNSVSDPGAISQPVSSWGDTSITLGALALSTFSYFTNLYVFVTNNSSQSNASGFAIQRGSVLSLTSAQSLLKSIAGVAQASLNNVRYRLSTPTINDTPFLSGNTATTDGSGNLSIPAYTLTSGGTPAPGADVWVVLAIEGPNQAGSKGTCVKITPNYT